MSASHNGAGSEAGSERHSGPVPGSWPGELYPRPKLQADPHRLTSRRFLPAHALWSRPLDGDRGWGSIDISPSRYRISRYGVSRYRLVVPPGIGRAERGRYRLWRTWPKWGALLWLAAAICLSARVSSWTAIGIVTALHFSSGAAALALAGKLRSPVRTLSVSVVDRRLDQRSAVTYDEFATLPAMLSEADVRRQSGQVSATDQQAVWSRVYDRLGPSHPDPAQTQVSL